MPGRIPESLIHQILDRVNLVELIGQQVKLKRVGRNYVGLCPFHADSNPSFCVSAEKGVYRCFGCGESGNAISYLMKARGMSFVESAELLARHAGIELRFEDGDRASYARSKDRRRWLLEVNREAHQFFRSALDGPLGEPGRTYLAERGIGRKMISTFQIGFCPTGAQLYETFVKKGVPLNLAEELGLVVKSRRTGSYWDRLSGRVIFPILTVGGEIAGFSGRALPGEPGPKYLNSPESEVFKKSELLFGLVQAREGIKRNDCSVLVEGQLDVVALREAGVENVVAPLGTALTEHQCAVLRRFAPNVVLMFDGDDAGRKATWRAMTLLMNQGLYGRVAVLPVGEDPDTLLRSRGVSGVREVLDGAKPFLEYAVETLAGSAVGSLHSRALAARSGMEFAGAIRNPIDRQLFVEQLSMRLGVSAPALRAEAARAWTRERTPAAPATERSCELSRKEQRLVEILSIKPELAKLVAAEDEEELALTPRVRAFVRALLDSIEEFGECRAFQVAEQLGDALVTSLCVAAELNAGEVPDMQVEQEVKEIIFTLKEDRLKEKLRRIAAEIRAADSSRQLQEVIELSRLQDDVFKRLSELAAARRGT